MPLKHLLHRCPRCGSRDVVGSGDAVRCPECGARFRRGRRGASLDVLDPAGKWATMPASRLVEAIQEMSAGEEEPEPPGVRHEAATLVRRGRKETPIGYRGGLMGFVEELGEPCEAVLRLTERELQLVGREGSGEVRWDLVDVRAVQATSSSLQIYTVDGELVQFRFRDASPLFWESLLHRELRRLYREAGRGEIVEFQPRISVR